MNNQQTGCPMKVEVQRSVFHNARLFSSIGIIILFGIMMGFSDAEARGKKSNCVDCESGSEKSSQSQQRPAPAGRQTQNTVPKKKIRFGENVEIFESQAAKKIVEELSEIQNLKKEKLSGLQVSSESSESSKNSAYCGERPIKPKAENDPLVVPDEIQSITEEEAQELFCRLTAHAEGPQRYPLSFCVPDDGCDNRAWVMTHLLNRRGVKPCLLTARGDHLYYKSYWLPKGKIKWDFHVAPIVAVDGKWKVFDPGIADRPVTPTEWLRAFSKYQLPLKNDPRARMENYLEIENPWVNSEPTIELSDEDKKVQERVSGEVTDAKKRIRAIFYPEHQQRQKSRLILEQSLEGLATPEEMNNLTRVAIFLESNQAPADFEAGGRLAKANQKVWPILAARARKLEPPSLYQALMNSLNDADPFVRLAAVTSLPELKLSVQEQKAAFNETLSFLKHEGGDDLDILLPRTLHAITRYPKENISADHFKVLSSLIQKKLGNSLAEKSKNWPKFGTFEALRKLTPDSFPLLKKLHQISAYRDEAFEAMHQGKLGKYESEFLEILDQKKIPITKRVQVREQAAIFARLSEREAQKRLNDLASHSSKNLSWVLDELKNLGPKASRLIPTLEKWLELSPAKAWPEGLSKEQRREVEDALKEMTLKKL